ncbi:MAG TPA: ABC transporter permease, partial [Microbacterium sp.]|nr:ABC transporter permease [Microbacterium sp.]
MRFILRRLGFYLVAFWLSITLNFLLPRLMPGDPVSRMLSRSQGQLDPSQIDSLRRPLGVD